MADFSNLTESQPPEGRRYQAAYADSDTVTTGWSAALMVIAHG